MAWVKGGVHFQSEMDAAGNRTIEIPDPAVLREFADMGFVCPDPIVEPVPEALKPAVAEMIAPTVAEAPRNEPEIRRGPGRPKSAVSGRR